MRIFTTILTLLTVLAASAQIEVGHIDRDAILGSAGDTPEIKEGTVFASTQSIVMKCGNTDTYRPQSIKHGMSTGISVNDFEIDLGYGIAGQTNPDSINIYTGPTKGGAQYRFEAKADGWLVVMASIALRKNYYVYEGNFDGDMKLMAYTLGMDVADAQLSPDGKIAYTLPADSHGYCDLASPSIDKYMLGGTAIASPHAIYKQNADVEENTSSGTGVIIFPVRKNRTYWVFATGSKMVSSGFVFVPGRSIGEVKLLCDNDVASDRVVTKGRTVNIPAPELSLSFRHSIKGIDLGELELQTAPGWLNEIDFALPDSIFNKLIPPVRDLTPDFSTDQYGSVIVQFNRPAISYTVDALYQYPYDPELNHTETFNWDVPTDLDPDVDLVRVNGPNSTWRIPDCESPLRASGIEIILSEEGKYVLNHTRSRLIDLYRDGERLMRLDHAASVDDTLSLTAGKYIFICFNNTDGFDLPIDNFTLTGPLEPEVQLAGPTYTYDGRYITFFHDEPEVEIHYTFERRGIWLPGVDWDEFPNEGIMTPGVPVDVLGAGDFLVNAKKAGFKDSEVWTVWIKGYAGDNGAFCESPGDLEFCYEWNGGTPPPSPQYCLRGFANEADFEWLRHRSDILDLDVSMLWPETEDGDFPANCFALPNLRSIELLHNWSGLSAKEGDETPIPLFGNTDKLRYIYWPNYTEGRHHYLKPGLLEGVDNPNLVILTSGPFAIDNEVRHAFNVIDLRDETHDIVLTDGYPFWMPDWVADCNVTYRRNFTKTTALNGETAGWETICLPFEVQEYTAKINNQYVSLKPFGADSDGSGDEPRFWLYGPGTKSWGEWQRADRMLGSAQYLIAFPNNPMYATEYNVAGEITFSSENVTLFSPALSGGWIDPFNDLVLNFEWVEKSETVMTVNDDWYEEGGKSYPPGSVFVANLRAARPFEPYIKTAPGQPAMRIFPNKSAIEGVLADIEGMTMIVTPGKGCITFRASADTDVAVHDLNGRLRATVHVTAGEPAVLDGLAPGLYLAGRRKVIVK